MECNESICSDASSWSFSVDDSSLVCLKNTTIASASSWSDQVSDSVISDASDWREEVGSTEDELACCFDNTVCHSEIVEQKEMPFSETPPREIEFEEEFPLTSTPCKSSFFEEVESAPLPTSTASRDDFVTNKSTSTFYSKPNPWILSEVMEMTGCIEQCVTKVHGLTEHDILLSHSAYQSKTTSARFSWILDYFTSSCPNNIDGSKDVKNIRYSLCGRDVCKPVWQAALGISSSRFYEVRKAFSEGTCLNERSCRPMAPRTLRALSWMSNYFERVGDKRPDKKGIYLPSCLTERMMYSIMKEQTNEEDIICFSQFNKLFRTNFSHVSIPKVSTTDCYLSLVISIYNHQVRMYSYM